ncbi:uncharacterized protein LOC101759931 [Setaria italica]|uniref:uncharacterized protein LOC101759931 n=1 Tax=Setaria italica TaxID=4555 RepID=UPI000350A5F1|nr:uncharacterized protein LOC101759931 [Setaria italica]
MQGQVPGQNLVNVPPPPPPEEPQQPAPNEGDQFVDVVGVEADIALPAAPEVDLYAHENLEGFDIEMEDNLGEAQMEDHQFAWANANVDGFDPQGHGPVGQWEEAEHDGEGEEEEEELEEIEGSSCVSTSSSSSSSSSSSDQGSESGSENSVNQPPPVVPPGQTLMIVDQDILQAVMARMGINAAELGIYPYGG